MIVLRSFSSKSNSKRKDSNHGQWVDEEGRHHSAYRSLASAMKAGGATLGAGAALGGTAGALLGAGGGVGLGQIYDQGKAAIEGSLKTGKSGKVVGGITGGAGVGTYGAYKGFKKALLPAAVLGTGYGLYRYGRGYKPKKDKKDKK